MEYESKHTADTENTSFCNCENEEVITPYQAEHQNAPESIMENCKAQFTKKCNEVKDTCRQTADRLVVDWKATDGDPYLKYTKSHRLEVYRTPEETVPVDTFESRFESKGFLRAMLLVSAASVLITCSAKHLIKLWMKR